MNTESQFEKMYNDLVAGLEKMHSRNVKITRDSLKCLFIIPTIFLILLFLTKSSKTIFLVLWIASMFIIAAVLIIIEYQDYLLKKMFTQLDVGNADAAAAETADSPSENNGVQEVQPAVFAFDNPVEEAAPDEAVEISQNS